MLDSKGANNMNLTELSVIASSHDMGHKIHGMMSGLFPIHRSSTGNGVRETLRNISQLIPIAIHEVPTGAQVLDWVVPKEWNIKDAYVKNQKGEKVIDYKKSNLHVVNSSIPIKATMSLEQLKERLHTIPKYPDWIPYRYSHYNENWGFCLSHNDFLKLEDGDYEVFIDSTLEAGHLTYGECYLKGQIDDEILIVCHICHPSLANDNLSGIAIATFLAKHLKESEHKHSYRFLFAPATIGSITWLAQNETKVDKIKHGVVLSCLGDPGHSTYKKSRQGNGLIDRAIIKVLSHSNQNYDIKEFAPYGYDERQFNSPGFNLPVGLFMRTPHDCFPQYHNSGDNLSFVTPDALCDSYCKLLAAFHILENDATYISKNQKGEAHLGRRGLYRQISGQADERLDELPVLWVMNYSDGQHSLLDIAEKSGFEFSRVKKAADSLVKAGLLGL